MPRLPAYKTATSPLPRILAALREGADLGAAARAGPVAIDTLARWMSSDPEVAAQVEAAQRAGKDRGPGAEAPSPPTEGGPRPALAGHPARPTEAGSPERLKPSSAEPTPRDRWAQVHVEAAALGPGLYGYLLWLEGRIASHNEKAPAWDRLPAMPAHLRAEFRRFVESGKQEFTILGGRGLGKTTMFCRFTLIECLFAPPVVSGGEVAIWAELAQDMDAAGLALGVLEKLLAIAGYRRRIAASDGEMVDEFKTLRQERGRSRIQFASAHHERIEIRVYPATVAALSGPTLKGARHDEERKWRANAKDGTSSAEEVIDAEGGAFRGRPQAHLYRMSSHWGRGTPHQVDVDGGDTADRMIARLGSFLDAAREGFEARARVSTPLDAAEIRAYAASLTAESPELPSWVNPSLDPRTLKARSVRVFLREYGSRTTDAGDEGDFFDGLLLDAAEQRERPAGPPDSVVYTAIDTGAKKNPATLAAVGRWDTDAGPRFAPLTLRAWKPSPGAPLDLRLVVLPEMARLTKALGADTWSSDGFASDQIDLVAGAHGIAVTYVATSEAHRDVYAPVADGLARGEVCLTGCAGAADAVAQLRRVSSEAELGAAGARIRMVVPEDAGGEHGDLGVALVRALAAAGCGATESDDGGAEGTPSRYAAEFERR